MAPTRLRQAKKRHTWQTNSASTLITRARGAGRHSCQLFDTPDSVATSVGAFIRDGLEAGDSVLAVMCPEHWASTGRYLRSEGVNPSAVLASGQFTMVDAATTLATFRRGGQIDPQLFDTSIGNLVRTLAAGDRHLRVYGEMVDVLAMEGDFKASLQLEALWNELMASVPIDLFCGYSAVNFGNPRSADALRLICAAHGRCTRTPPTCSQHSCARACRSRSRSHMAPHFSYVSVGSGRPRRTWRLTTRFRARLHASNGQLLP